ERVVAQRVGQRARELAPRRTHRKVVASQNRYSQSQKFQRSPTGSRQTGFRRQYPRESSDGGPPKFSFGRHLVGRANQERRSRRWPILWPYHFLRDRQRFVVPDLLRSRRFGLAISSHKSKPPHCG